MKTDKWSPWKPYPPGVFTASLFGMVSILYLVIAVVQSDGWFGLIALFIGAICIMECVSAGKTVGMRMESHGRHLQQQYWESIQEEDRDA